MGKLDRKIAVVTGASKGIGAAIAIELAGAGAAVVVNYARSKDAAERVVATIVAAGGNAVSVGADITTDAGVAALIAATADIFGRVDILVNNAGVYAFGALATVTPEEYHRQFDINVLALLMVTKAALPLFPAAGGSVVNIGSVVSSLAPKASVLSAGSKAAVDTITRSLAKELGPRGIRVNAINPGVIMTEGLVAGGLAGGEFEQHAAAAAPLGRIGQPEDIALPVLFMASDDARFITGETLFVTGGAFT